MTRGILATCYARPTRRRRPPRRCSRCCRDAYADEPFVVVTDEPPSTKATLGLEHRPPHRPLRRAHRLGRRALRHRQPGEGRGRPGRSSAPTSLLGLDETAGLPTRRGVPMSRCPPPRSETPGDRRERHAPAGFVAAGVPCGIKAGGAPDLALVATDERSRSPRRPCSPRTRRPPRRCIVTRAHLARDERPGGRGRPQQRQRQRRHRRGRAATTPSACARWSRASSAARPTRCSCARPGSSASRCRWTRSRRACRRSCAARSSDGGARGGRGHPHHRHASARRWSSQGDGFTVGGMAKGAAMLAPNMATMLAVLTTDAACEPRRCAPRSSPRVDDSFNALSVDGCTSTNDTVIVLASGRAGPVERRLRCATRSPRRAPTWPRRWPATPRARPRSCGCG